MSSNTISFYKLKHFLKIRNLFFLLFKITTIIIFLLLVCFIFFIVLLSTKPRKIRIINNYIIEKLNKIENIDFNYNPETSFLKFNENFDLVYNIDNFSVKTDNIDFFTNEILLNIDFGKLLNGEINVKKIIFTNSNINLYQNDNKEVILQKNNNEDFDYKVFLKILQNKITSSTQHSFLIQEFQLNKLALNFIKNNVKESTINFYKVKSNINLLNDNFIINQSFNFKFNNTQDLSRLELVCDDENGKICNLKLYNIDIKHFKKLSKNNQTIYEYINNIDLSLNLNFNVSMDEDFNFTSGNINLFSTTGSFYLKEFFEEKILFNNLDLSFSFKNNFKEFAIDSLTTKIDNMDFFMSLFFKSHQDYNNLDLVFKTKNLDFKNLRKLWPKNLGQEEEIRPWVLEHIISGTSPSASANINMKFFNNNEKDSGLQKIYSKIELNNISLNYDNYFPKITNINGTAIFTENNMNIKINSANVLSSKINSGNIFMDFNTKIPELDIKANVKGPFADLFIHIDKSEAQLIKTSVNNAIQDYYTDTKLQIKVPLIDDLDFNKVFISANCNLLNKPYLIFQNSANILISFIKKQYSGKFLGQINLTNSELVFLPLNIVKEAKKKLVIDYSAELVNDNMVNITKFTPQASYITFNTKGYIDFDKNEYEISFTDVNYNNSNFNVFYNSYTIKDKIFNNLIIRGKNINYANIIDRLQKVQLNNKKNKNIKKDINKNKSKNTIKNELVIKADLDYFNFANNKKLYKPTLMFIIKDDKFDILEFYAKTNKKSYIQLMLDKGQNNYKISSNNFGEILSSANATEILKNGDGYIEFKENNNKFIGTMELRNGFSIVPNNNIKTNVSEDVKESEDFKDIKKDLDKNKGINFTRMTGNFSYSNNILNLEDVIARGKYTSFQILLSGPININNGTIDIEGLFVPAGIINGLFGINKIPLISNVIFGQKNGGLFAVKFEIIKNKDEELKININKLSTIFPGSLRNLLMY